MFFTFDLSVSKILSSALWSFEMEAQRETNDDADYIDITPPSFIYFKDNLIHYDFTKAVFNGKEDSLINFDLNKAYGINLFEYD